MTGVNVLAGLNPHVFQRKNKIFIKFAFLASMSDYLLFINVLKQIILDFCGIKHNSTTNGHKKNKQNGVMVANNKALVFY